MHRMRIPILLFSTLLLLAGCPSEPSAAPESAASQVSAALAARFHGTDISQDPIGGDFTLTSHNGRSVSLSDFRGKIVVLVFGYTHCPDVCPTHLLKPQLYRAHQRRRRRSRNPSRDEALWCYCCKTAAAAQRLLQRRPQQRHLPHQPPRTHRGDGALRSNRHPAGRRPQNPVKPTALTPKAT